MISGGPWAKIALYGAFTVLFAQTPISLEVRIPRDADQCSELMSISIPKGCRSVFRTETDQFYGCSLER